VWQTNGQLSKEIRTYGTTSQEILAIAEWLQEQEWSHGAMEGTGVSWKPVYNLLEDPCEVLVVNAQQSKAVPGRKTDVKDAGANRSAYTREERGDGWQGKEP
jgi:transposase